jgi:hypothetical protein
MTEAESDPTNDLDEQVTAYDNHADPYDQEEGENVN